MIALIQIILTLPPFSNKVIASRRVLVEHVFRKIKTFKIMSHVYRNKGKKHDLRFNIIAGITNLKLGI